MYGVKQFELNTTVIKSEYQKADEEKDIVSGLDNLEQKNMAIDQQKQVMKVTKCPHANRKHYAKNMCSSCYRKYGRN